MIDPRSDVLADILGTTLLRNALYRRIECRAPWGMSVPPRERATFYVVVRGGARLEVAGEAVTELSAGDAVFLPHGTAHVLRDTKTSKAVPVCDGAAKAYDVAVKRIGGDGAPTSLVAGFFLFAGKRPSLLETIPKVVLLTATDPTLNRWIAATLQLLLGESSAPGPASTIVLARLADVLFVQMLRTLTLERPGASGALSALADPAIRDALALMHRAVAHPWTVASLAKTVGLSRSAFASRFTKLVGESPLQYLARWRIARAAELLRDTDDRVSTIASRVGYDSVPSFTKAFRRWQGESPTGLRRRDAIQ